MKQALKIKLENQTQFKKAWNALVKLGYHCPEELVPLSADYLLAYADGLIREIVGADPTSLRYFENIEHKEITLNELLNLAKQDEHEPIFDYISLTKKERPLFEQATQHQKNIIIQICN